MDEQNDTCKLVKPDETMLDEIASYRAAFLAAGSSMDGTGPLRQMEDPLDWVELCRAAERREEEKAAREREEKRNKDPWEV